MSDGLTPSERLGVLGKTGAAALTFGLLAGVFTAVAGIAVPGSAVIAGVLVGLTLRRGFAQSPLPSRIALGMSACMLAFAPMSIVLTAQALAQADATPDSVGMAYGTQTGGPLFGTFWAVLTLGFGKRADIEDELSDVELEDID